MQTFLQEIAKMVITDYSHILGDVTVIFPNRRAGLYFREYLKMEINGPMWSPQILSFQDFVAMHAPMQKADQLFLIHKLFEVYNKTLKTSEGFERFYYWGQMLLKDFDDADKYLVNAKNLYTNLRRQKQLDLTFDFLDAEQKDLIQQFWQGWEGTKSSQKEKFEFIWDRLHAVYQGFQEALRKEGLCYEGMQYRHIAERVDQVKFRYINGPVIFAGFNAFNSAEEKIITWFIQNKGSRIIWDLDDYYFSDTRQEAGNFLRAYRSVNVFKATFPEVIPQFFSKKEAPIIITGVPQHVGQAKVLGQKLRDLLRTNPGVDLRKIAVVLADEALLFPVLHSLPDDIEAINVTMGFPLAYAPVNSLIEHILELQNMLRKDEEDHLLFHFKPALAVMRHPLVMQSDAERLERWTNEIERNNKVFFTQYELPDSELIKSIFRESGDDIVSYLSEVLLTLHELSKDQNKTVELEYVHHYYQLLNRYADLLRTTEAAVNLKSFGVLFRQLVRTERLPFTGEPLRGLQVMGVLETRNLDFDHVFVLSMNEDFFPSQGGRHSFIPYNLRKAYGLPNYDQQDAIYAYLFYRLLQRPQNINLFYNTEGNDLGGAEMSRFLQQLIHESGLNIKSEVLSHDTVLQATDTISVEKNDQVMEGLNRYVSKGDAPEKRLSPSAINTYLDCRLRFYFRYVADLYEKNSMDEDVDARTLGNVLHFAMEELYRPCLLKKGSNLVEKQDFTDLKEEAESAVIKAFRRHFSIDDDRKFYFEGKNIIAKEIILEFMKKTLRIDEKYAPFEMMGMEQQYTMDLPLEGFKVGLRGTIDRLDRKGHRVRLIDYKTGKDTHTFGGIEELFDRKKRNKAAFQTFNYALLYRDQKLPDDIMIPAVFNKDAIFMGEDFYLVHKKFGQVNNAEQYLDEYKEHLKILLSEIFDQVVPFDQTDDVQKCNYCAYHSICNR